MNIDDKAGIVLKAMKYAERKHKGQVRKGSGSPYFHHPLMVSYIAANFKKSKNLHTLIAAAILHDVVEDCDVNPHTITKMFGMGVSKLVFELTDDKDEIKIIGKVEYQKKKWCGLSNYGLFLKLCDRLANVSDNPKAQYIDDTLTVLNNLMENRRLTRSQRSVCDEIYKVIDKFYMGANSSDVSRYIEKRNGTK